MSRTTLFRGRTTAVLCSLALASAAILPATYAFAQDDDADTITKNFPDRTKVAIPSRNSGVRLHLGLGGKDFGSLYWLDYSQMTDVAWEAANTPEGTDIVFDMPSGGTLSMHLSIENGKPVKSVLDGEEIDLPFEPLNTKKWGAFGAPSVDENGDERTDPYGFNYRLPNGAKPGLGYPELNQDSPKTDPYDVTVRFTDISFTTPSGTAGDYRAVFTDMEATDAVGVEQYTVSVDNFGKTPNPGVTLTKFDELYSKYANRSQDENRWAQYGARKKPCVNVGDDVNQATITCDPVSHDAANVTGPGDQMFSALNTSQIAFNFKGKKPNGYGIGFLLPYQAGTVTVKHGNLPESEQSNFDLTLKTNNSDEGGTVVTTQGDLPVTVTRNVLVVPGEPVTYTSMAKKKGNNNYTPSWSCQRGSLAPGDEESGKLTDVKLKELNVEKINENGTVGSRVSVKADDAQAFVYCSVVWTAKKVPTVTVTTTETTTITKTGTPTTTPSSEPTTPGDGDGGDNPDKPGDGDGGDNPDKPGDGANGDNPDKPGDGDGGDNPDKPGNTTTATTTTPGYAVTVTSTVTTTQTAWVTPTPTSTATTTTTAPATTQTVTTTPTTVTTTPTTVTETEKTSTTESVTNTATTTESVENPSTTSTASTTVTEPTTVTQSTTVTNSTTSTAATTVTEPTTVTESTTSTAPTTVTASTTSTEPVPTTVTESTTSTAPTTVTELTTSTEPVPTTVTSTTNAGGSSNPGDDDNSGSSAEAIIPIIIGLGVVGTIAALTMNSGSADTAALVPAAVPANVVKQPDAAQGPTVLAVTGADTNALTGLAILLLVGGAAALVLRRRA